MTGPRVRRGSPQWHAKVAAHLRRVSAVIAERGWVVQGVFPVGPGQIGFAYTVGLHEAGLPEIVVSGDHGERAEQLLDVCARMHLAAELVHGATITNPQAWHGPLRVIDAPRAQLGMAVRLYSRVRAVQVVSPDAAGLWPGSSFAAPGGGQELFGDPWW